MGIGGVAVIGVGLALAVGSVTAVVSSKTESDGGQPVELVDARKDEADDGVRLVDDDDNEDDTTGDGTTVGATTVGDTTGVGARSAPAPAPAPAGTTPRQARPAPAPKPAPAPRPAPAPPADDSFSADSVDASSYLADSSG